MSASQFSAVLPRRAPGDPDLLAFLQGQGLITAGQVANIRAAHREVLLTEATRLGELAVQKMMITPEQLAQALEIQRASASPIRLGEVLTQAGLITVAQRDALVQALPRKPSVAAVAGPVLSKARTVVAGQWQRFRGLPTKTQGIIGGGVGLVLLVIVLVGVLGGTAKVKPDCTLNIYGRGMCAFTNTGSPGSICGHLYAECGSKSRASGAICSGEVRTNETKNVEFSFPGYGDLAVPYGSRWKDECSFIWVPHK